MSIYPPAPLVHHFPMERSSIYENMKTEAPKSKEEEEEEEAAAAAAAAGANKSISEQVFAMPEIFDNILHFVMLDDEMMAVDNYNVGRIDVSTSFPRSIGRLSMVSKRFNEATSSNELWRDICFSQWEGISKFKKRALRSFSNTAARQQVHFWKACFFQEEYDVRELIRSEAETWYSDIHDPYFGEDDEVDEDQAFRDACIDYYSLE